MLSRVEYLSIASDLRRCLEISLYQGQITRRQLQALLANPAALLPLVDAINPILLRCKLGLRNLDPEIQRIYHLLIAFAILSEAPNTHIFITTVRSFEFCDLQDRYLLTPQNKVWNSILVPEYELALKTILQHGRTTELNMQLTKLSEFTQQQMAFWVEAVKRSKITTLGLTYNQLFRLQTTLNTLVSVLENPYLNHLDLGHCHLHRLDIQDLQTLMTAIQNSSIRILTLWDNQLGTLDVFKLNVFRVAIANSKITHLYLRGNSLVKLGTVTLSMLLSALQSPLIELVDVRDNYLENWFNPAWNTLELFLTSNVRIQITGLPDNTPTTISALLNRNHILIMACRHLQTFLLPVDPSLQASAVEQAANQAHELLSFWRSLQPANISDRGCELLHEAITTFLQHLIRLSGQHDLNIDVYLPQLLLLLPAKSLATRYLYGDYAHHTLMHASKEAWMHAMKYGLDIDGQLVNFSNQIQTICDVYLRRALGETVNVINVSSLTCVKRLVLAQRLMLSTLQTCELKQPLALIQTEILQGLKDRIKQELSELPADINDHTLPHLQKLWDIAELKLEQAGIKLEDQYLAGWKFTTQLGLYVTSYEKQKAAAQSLLAGEKSRFFADSSAQKENISTDLTQSPVQPAKSEWIHD